MESDDKVQKVEMDTSEDVQDSAELNKNVMKKEEREDASSKTKNSDEPENLPLEENTESVNPDGEVPNPTAGNSMETESKSTRKSNAPPDQPEEIQQQEVAKQQVVEEQAEAVIDLEAAQSDPVEGSESHISDSEEDKGGHAEVLVFDHAGKKELLSKLKGYKNEDDVQKIDSVLKATKLRFDELYTLTKNEALQKFVSEGNEADSFEYREDEEERAFITLYSQLKAKRNKYHKELIDQKEDNLKRKERLLENLRIIVDGEESVRSITTVKEIQTEWKKIGPAAGAQNNSLWANYNALLDRYYDNRSIYFELKDLDRKKNMQQKQELCEKAETLTQLDDIKAAIVQLNDLHEEYKHVGPVPKADQEPLWQRFKAASDTIYAKRKAYFEALKVEFKANLIKKLEIIKEVEEFLNFRSERITEWNDRTKTILELQKRWETLGGVPKDKAKEINKAFWHSFKKFFANKNQFFKELKGKREENLTRKQELIVRAEELKDSDEWESTAQKLKNLQAEWKEIGPIPEKLKEEINGKFKDTCNYFFNRRRDQNEEQLKEYDENLNLKKQICHQIETFSESDEVNLGEVYDLVDHFISIGFVPKNAIKKIAHQFEAVIEKILANPSIQEKDKMDLKNHIEIKKLRSTFGGNRKIRKRENSIRKKISTLENDISTWNTNMEFFANSAAADKLKAETQEKVEAAERELADLKSQLRSIR
ncbi:MAG: DUF349 domain-containing protein [Ekhidna sp.]|nr:DUF349 domain-containing protein [Ekhidna sp.]